MAIIAAGRAIRFNVCIKQQSNVPCKLLKKQKLCQENYSLLELVRFGWWTWRTRKSPSKLSKAHKRVDLLSSTSLPTATYTLWFTTLSDARDSSESIFFQHNKEKAYSVGVIYSSVRERGSLTSRGSCEQLEDLTESPCHHFNHQSLEKKKQKTILIRFLLFGS